MDGDGLKSRDMVEAETRIRIPYVIHRDAWDQDHFDHMYDYEKCEDGLRARVAKKLKQRPTRRTLWRLLITFLPILDWLPKYKLAYLSTDVIAGATIGVFKIPQAMAYASLAGVPPVTGLYSSFFPPLLYAFLGTSRHISLGVFAVVSLMLGGAQRRVINAHLANNATTGDENLEPLDVVTTLTFVVGVVLILLAIFQLSFVANYMSDQVVGGFTTASALHVIASQLDKIIGAEVKEYQGLFTLPYTLRDIILAVPNTNVAALVISLICIPFLYVGNQMINPRMMKAIRVPIPFELVAVLFGTLLSHFFNFEKRFDLGVVSTIPKGLPSFKMPRFSLIPELIGDGIAIAIVLFAVTISVAKLFAKKHHYKINPAQELRALGFANMITSTLSCQGASGSLSRASVNSMLGVHTQQFPRGFESEALRYFFPVFQLASVVTAGLILSVILWIGPLLESLPKVQVSYFQCILACIIIVALQGMLKQFAELVRLWPISKIDFTIWLVAFVATAVWDLMQGLVIAIVFALGTVIFRTQWPQSVQLARIPDTDLYRDHARYKTTKLFDDIAILRFDSPLLFTNIEHFKAKVEKVLKRHSKQMGENGPFLKNLIIDGSGFTYIDTMGVGAIGDLYESLAGRNVALYMAACKAPVRDLFECSGMYKKIPKCNFHPSVHDAVLHAMQTQQAVCERM